MSLGHLTRAGLVAVALLLSACLEVPGPPLEEPVDSGDPPRAAGEPDASMVDEPVACDDQFGGAPGYMWCSETEDTCSFFSSEDDVEVDCDQRCAEFGTTCAGGFDAPGDGCTLETEDGCATQHVSQVCVCRRR